MAELFFKSEDHLVEKFITTISASGILNFFDLKLGREFDYKRGRTDVIALNLNGELFAFEAKLAKWKNALQQAYRNTCYAHYSYVLVPEVIAHKAIKYEYEFKRRKVGICYINRAGQIQVLSNAEKNKPLQMWLCEKAITNLRDGEYKQNEEFRESCAVYM